MANPFVAGATSADTVENNLPEYKEYAWDFENDTFIYENGQHKIVTQNEALKIWVYKALKTERWRYLAYDNSYGIELEQFVGASTNSNENSIIIAQYITETLLINPYIKSIDSIIAAIDGDKLSYKIAITSIYGTFIASTGGTT